MTGHIFLPCGHEDEVLPFGIPFFMRDQTDEGAPAICYTQYCRECFKKVLDDKDWVREIFFSGDEADAWLDEAYARYTKSRKHIDLKIADKLEKQAKELRRQYDK